MQWIQANWQYLLIGAAFIFMMRNGGCCGGHGGHGGHSGQNQQEKDNPEKKSCH